MSASVPPTPRPPKRPRGRWFKIRVIIAAILILAAFLVYLNGRNQAPPRVLAVLSQGRAYLDVPVMTYYSFPYVSAPGYWVQTNYSFAASTRMAFDWSNASGNPLPVRFVLSSSGPFQADATGGFTYAVTAMASGTGSSVVRPGVAALEVSYWAMDYVVREMAVYDWLGEDRWIEVDYSLATHSGCLCDLPAANTTAASSGDLAPVGVPLNLRVDAGLAWTYGVSVNAVSLPVSVFRHALPALTFSLGSLGSLSANLASRFQWTRGADYVMRMGGTGPANVSFQLYLDRRFGSLMAEPLA